MVVPTSAAVMLSSKISDTNHLFFQLDPAPTRLNLTPHRPCSTRRRVLDEKAILSLLVASLLFPLAAAGQNRSRRNSKAIAISGRVSEDGKSLIAKNGEPWSVTNPDALAGHESQWVKVKGEQASLDHHIRVRSVRILATPTTHGVNLGDANFRR
jgi:hypothetical protein